MKQHHGSLFHKPQKQLQQKPPRKWVLLPLLWKSFKHVLMGLGFLVLLSLIFGGVSTYYLMQSSTPEIPEEMILIYRLDGEVAEGPAQKGLSSFGREELTLKEIIDTIEVAKSDERVKALIFNVRRSRLAISQIQELRQAILDFRNESDKKAYIYSISYSEAGQGLALYSLASAFDEIWMGPLGTLAIDGVRLEQPYIRGMLDFIGIFPQFYQREEYKGVFDMFQNSEMPQAVRISLQSLLKSLTDQFIKDIVSGRKQTEISERQFTKLMDQGLFFHDEAPQQNLVDLVDHGDRLLSGLRIQLGYDPVDEEPPLVGLHRYLQFVEYEKTKDDPIYGQKEEPRDEVAVIYVMGPIMLLGKDESGSSFVGNTSQSADEVAGLIVDAAQDENIKAIVIRVDSPGGSPTASELIRRSIERAQEMDKPVIVSMGSMAASGGYWVAAGADHIFALPGTITGSIGVAGGKASGEALWTNLFINWDYVGVGENAGMYSMNTPFSPSQEVLINKSMDRIYDRFLEIVQEGRDMTPTQARAIAQGRVWSGLQARQNGLVDTLGSLNDALDYAAKTIGYEGRQDVDVILLPEPKSTLEEIIELLQQTASLPPALHSAVRVWSGMQEEHGQALQDLSVMSRSNSVMVYDSIGTVK